MFSLFIRDCSVVHPNEEGVRAGTSARVRNRLLIRLAAENWRREDHEVAEAIS